LSERLLILGGRGMLGTELAHRAADRFDVAVKDLPELDVTNTDGLAKTVARAEPQLVVNCAAWTDVDGAETNPKAARAVNAVGAAEAATAARKAGARFIHISTDFVFDGASREPYSEQDMPNPLGVYGQTKFEGENLVLAANHGSCVVRTAWTYGAFGNNFVAAILKRARAGKQLRVVSDQVGSPTWTRDLADAILLLDEKRATGIVHFTNSGAVSRFEEARAILEILGLDNDVQLEDSASLGTAAPRPAYSALALNKYETISGEAPRPWRNALAEYLYYHI